MPSLVRLVRENEYIVEEDNEAFSPVTPFYIWVLGRVHDVTRLAFTACSQSIEYRTPAYITNYTAHRDREHGPHPGKFRAPE